MTYHELLPFQIEGAKWLAGRKLALLGDEMRLGKSPQTVVAADAVGADSILVVAPAVARTNWRREFERWSRRDAISNLYVCSFEFAVSHVEELSRYRWDLLVIDEVHFCKTVEAKRTRAIFGGSGLVRHAKRVWALSGTPAPNHAGELWVILYSFGITPLSYEKFLETYCDLMPSNFGDRGMKVVGTKRSKIPELRGMLSRVMLRRTMKQVLPDHKEPLISSFVVEPGSVDGLIDLTEELEAALKKQQSLISNVIDSTILAEDEKLRMLEGLARSVSTLRRYNGLQLVEPACELIAGELEIQLYSKIVVFAIHREVVSAIAKKLREKGFKVVTLNGDSSPREKQEAQDLFNSDPTVQVFIGNIISAGTNITLAAAHDVLLVEEDWVPGNNLQAIKRCGHVLKTRGIHVRFLALANPLCERISRTVRKKTKELSEIFDCR